MDTLTEISLFTGYGGFTLGLRLAGVEVQTVCYVEKDPYCQRIIEQRIADGHLDDAPLWDDITTFDGRPWRGQVDLVTGGFPCQDLSTAGKRAGLDGERSGLWWEMLRCIREVGPRYVLIENVPGILVGGQAGTVVGELSGLGYDSVWHCLPAAAVGAPHLRWRWWCLAYSTGERCASEERQHDSVERGQQFDRDGQDRIVADTDRTWELQPQGIKPNQRRWSSDSGETVADAEHNSEAIHQQHIKQSDSYVDRTTWWAVEPPLGRVADGIASRVDRLRALGNGVVPAVVVEFLRMLEA